MQETYIQVKGLSTFFSNKAESILGYGHLNPLPYSVSIRI